MALIMPNGNRTVTKPFAQPFGAPPGSMPTPSKPGPGRPSEPMPQYGQPGGMTPSKPGPARPSVPMMQNYAPGQAKPQQSPYATATPYGGQAGGQQAPGYGSPQGQRGQMRTADFRDRDGDRVDDRDQDGAGMPAYGRPSQPQQSPYAPSTPYAQPRAPVELADPRIAEAGIMAGEGGFRQPPNGPAAPVQPTLQQYMAPGNPLPGPMSRPAPFQATTRNFDGTTSEMPNFQQRDAFIGQINNQLGQMQNQSWQQPGMGAPQFDFPTMWGQAGEMAQQGFQNPFAAQDPVTQIRRLRPQEARLTRRYDEPSPVLKAPGSPGDPSPKPDPSVLPDDKAGSAWQARIDNYQEQLRRVPERRADQRASLEADLRKQLAWAEAGKRQEDAYVEAGRGYDIGSPASRDKLQAAIDGARRTNRRPSAPPAAAPSQPAPRPSGAGRPHLPMAGGPAGAGQWVRQLDGSYLPPGVDTGFGGAPRRRAAPPPQGGKIPLSPPVPPPAQGRLLSEAAWNRMYPGQPYPTMPPPPPGVYY